MSNLCSNYIKCFKNMFVRKDLELAIRAVGCVEMTQKAAGAAGCCEFGGEQPLLPGDARRDCESEGGREGWRSAKKGSRRFPYSLYHDGEEVQKIAQRSTSPWIHTGWDFLCFQGDRTLSHLSLYALRPAQDLGRRLNFAAFPKFRRFISAPRARQSAANIYFLLETSADAKGEATFVVFFVLLENQIPLGRLPRL